MFTLIESAPNQAVIKVVGVGGGGCNAIQHMLATNQVPGVQFICANTDAQALDSVEGATVLQLGGAITRGLGAGANPEVGRQSALEDREKLVEALTGADMVFVTAGMGGGTGTGAAPIVAEVSKELGILTVGVVTKPFRFEGKRRLKVAEAGVEALRQYVDSLISIPNEKLLTAMDDDISLLDAFAEADNVLLNAVQGVSDLIVRQGKINVDFADVRTVMSEMGMAMMGAGVAKGEGRAVKAAEEAIRSPLLEDVNLQGARGVLVNITAGVNLGLREYQAVGDIIEEFAAEDATIVIGTAIDPELTDEIRVTVVATGIGEREDRPTVAVDNTRKPVETNYQKLDRPTVMRRRDTEQRSQSSGGRSDNMDDLLDVPAFLRRQAD
ncbi:cell division protein FtsZ [Natronospirillum operosum]|uniref:Cell division protein FtsZ n=1 Tax=Natronospirillum operosum TaxID=2759953 RepID=A0A4Z0WDF3_9GAMM|nr:cell division protein FtsZ [Natronospirillum operosum]TGG92964.1 cell division protein FtsZ [Natronospirillum operosum]